MSRFRPLLMTVAFLFLSLSGIACAKKPLEPIAVSQDGTGFVLAHSRDPFTVWGVNYDHDGEGRLLEDYWATEWDTVESDFTEIRELGANTIRIHLQFARFMKSPDEPDEAALKRLEKLLRLAESNDLYLDITGLGCYHKQDVPDWYDKLSEKARWDAQANFWSAIAKTCAHSDAVFCYDLMNEPVVPGNAPADDWLGPAFAGKHFVQFISREAKDRPRAEIARDWIRHLKRAIRTHDRTHLITVGLVPWSLPRPGLQSGFEPQVVGPELDFVAVHIYPESGNIDEAMETLRGFEVGKPIVIEEIFPLKCNIGELELFINKSWSVADGWIGFYWGRRSGEYDINDFSGMLVRHWIEYFASESVRKAELKR